MLVTIYLEPVMSFHKSFIIISMALAFNANAANNTTFGNNAYSEEEYSITIGKNAINTGFKSSDIVIGTDSQNGVVGRFIKDGKVVTNVFDRHTGNIVIGSDSSAIAETLNTIIGSNITDVHRENTLIGGSSKSSVYDATSLGYDTKVETEGGIALGNGSTADRKAGRYGYNAATGNYYSANDIINDSNNSRFGHETLTEKTAGQQQALIELKNKRENYTKAFSDYKKQALKLSSKIFTSEDEYNTVLNTYKKASDTFSKAKKEYEAARKKVTDTSSTLKNAGQGRVSTTGALSIADENNLRQLTGLAAGSANTDAVNVKQLRDYAAATKTSMEATKGRLTKTESMLTKHNSTIKRLTETEKEHETGIKTNSDAIGDLKKLHASGMQNINNRINDMDVNMEATKQRLVTTESMLSEHNTTINSLTETQKEHQTGIKANSDAIRDLKKLHASGMQNINSRINRMDKKLERGLAANAALAGLMQPYNVGKFNITVGLGGYRSATAIAAGAGYRFSNSAAIKAGIATNTANFDDLSYNMSTAFEF